MGFITIESKDIKDIIKELNIDVIYLNENTIKFKNNIPYDKLIKKLSNYEIEKILIEDMNLEDMFLHYYK